MKNIFVIAGLFILTNCASQQTKDYEKARLEANPNYMDASNQNGTPFNYTPKERNSGEYFFCLVRNSQYFNSKDSRWICQ